ncbi:MAG: efflux RND transporter periplasmic adaptor subunit [Planctomycetota bacterium]
MSADAEVPETDEDPEAAQQVQAYSAVTVPQVRIVLSSKMDENVREILVEEGDRVEEDEKILRFDARQIDAQIEVARVDTDYEARMKRGKARLEYLRREYERSKRLSEGGESMISESELHEHRSEMEQAAAELEDLHREQLRAEKELELYQARRNDYIIRAPIDGVVSRLWVEEGEMAREGEELMELVDPDAIEVRAHLPEKLAGQIQSGQEGTVRFGCVGGRSLPATVTFVSPYVDSSSGTFMTKLVTVDPKNQIKPGMGCMITFQQSDDETSSDSE